MDKSIVRAPNPFKSAGNMIGGFIAIQLWAEDLRLRHSTKLCDYRRNIWVKD